MIKCTEREQEIGFVAGSFFHTISGETKVVKLHPVDPQIRGLQWMTSLKEPWQGSTFAEIRPGERQRIFLMV